MKLGIVVQRYGVAISGGAELHARQVATHLARRAEVSVLTTCAHDYITWRNAYPAGTEVIDGVRVERFPVLRERDIEEFGRRSELVFGRRHSLQDELAWLDSEGPVSPDLLDRVRRAGSEFDYLVVFSIRYHQAYHAALDAPGRTVLVPTAERDPALGLGIFSPIFRGVRAVMYNSPEERALIEEISGNEAVPGCVVGVGVNLDTATAPERFRQKYGITRPFVLYVGRIDANKGCQELFDYFRAYVGTTGEPPLLVLIGAPIIPVPDDPNIRHLGHLSDEDKHDALAGAVALAMPSYFESLSMVLLEAWAASRPVLVNARCDVLLGQCLRSDGGLFYHDAAEFCGALGLLLSRPELADALGRNGRAYCERLYAWPVVEAQYMNMFTRLDAEAAPSRRLSPPGWLARHRRTERPARDVVADATVGPVMNEEDALR
ncbi:MAG: glycosyltransferase family 4 protein [Vicinamibacterales bacterium]|nr:glycosyltransferase family 4 protein [Vicinamibacterales bacterium]